MIKAINDYFKRIDDYYEVQEQLISTANIDRQMFSELTKTYIRYNPKVGLILTLLVSSIAIFSVYMDFHYYGTLDKMSLISLSLLLFIILAYYTNTITISPYGIKAVSVFGKTEFTWEEVESIGITLEDFNVTNGDYVSFFLVYVSINKDIDKPAQIKGDRDGIITFRFRAEMMHHILCVCDLRVDRLYCVRKWKKYLIGKGYLCNQ